MREQRNPFLLRSSERIESDATFLRLFGPGMLDIMPADQLWDRVHILRSAPGGGKTSLMRLFTPSALLTLHAYQTSEECKELYQRMRDLGVVGDTGPRLLGVMLSCRHSYATLADLELDQGRRERLFFGLLNARIVLATLRGALTLKKLDYPGDLHRLSIASSPDDDIPSGLNLPCSGEEIYEWAKGLEATVCEAIDSLGPWRAESLSGHEAFTSLMLLRPECIAVDRTPVAERIVLLLDDVHKLTRQQRERLIQTIIDMRSPLGMWIAERFEALSTDEMLSSGAIQERDYERVLSLEKSWREKGKRFENLVLNIADRRARAASDAEIGSFSSCLQTSLDAAEWQQKISQAVDVVSVRVKALAGTRSLFQEWVAARETMDGTPRERAIAWRTLEILVERENRKVQKSFDFGTLSPEDLENQDDSGVKAAAELFLAKEFRLPYYFGPARLSAIASSNIEQFLWLAGEQFEEAVSAALIKKAPDLTPDRQEAITKKMVQTRWDDVPRRVRNGHEVRSFLEAIGNFANWATYQPNAPYAPGVTGIAISMRDRDKLRDPGHLKANPTHAKLAEILASALAHNLLEPILDYKCKGDRWMVLYLNRLLCVQFALPLQHGGWREKTLKELCRWLEQGFKPPREESFL